MERTPFGINELDSLMEGGIPKGGLVIVAGSPGVGKTVLSAQFIYNGATIYGDKGVYVCLAESKEHFKSNVASLGWDFTKLEEKRMVGIIEFPTMANIAGVDIVNLIVDEVKRFKAQRLVVDSISAINLALTRKSEIRAFVGLFTRMLKNLDCTTLMTTENPWGSNSIGMGIEEFVADGIINMESVIVRNRLEKRLMILKMRATDHDTRCYRLSISKGSGISLSLYPEM